MYGSALIELTDKIPIICFQYGTKALDKITKAILGHIENKVPPPKSYIGGDAMFFRGMCRKSSISDSLFITTSH